jgi:general secretion pathway protein L
MAQRIVGLDLGSASITVVHLESRGRSGDFEVLLYDEEHLQTPFVEGQALSREECYLTAFDALRERGALKGDVFVTGLPGDEVSMRMLSFPFSDRRKIEQALPFELESEIPFDIDEIVFSWRIIDNPIHQKESDDGEQTEVMVCFVRRETMDSHLELLEQVGIDPRHIAFDALILKEIYDHIYQRETNEGPTSLPLSTPGGTVIETGPDAPEEAIAIIDIGHQRTQICIVAKGQVIQAQTILHGGADATRALAREIGISLSEAEKGKRKEAFLEVSGRVAQFPEQRKISEILKKAYSPVIRRMRQIFQATISSAGARVLKVVLIGGGSRVLNLEEYFSEVLNIKVERGQQGPELFTNLLPLSPDAVASNLSDDKPNPGAALGYALLGIAGTKEGRRIDFRTGEYSFKGELDFVKERAVSLVAWASTIVLLLVLSGASRMWTLGVNEAELVERQLAACENITGQRIESSTRCLALIQEKIQGQSGFSLPDDSAADIYLEISRRIPPQSEMQRKVTELDVNMERVRLKVTATDFDAVDKIVAKLADGRCLSKVEKGKARNVKSKVDFNVNIRLDCVAAPGKEMKEDTAPPKEAPKAAPEPASAKVKKPEKSKRRAKREAAKRKRENAKDEGDSQISDSKKPRDVSEARKSRRDKIRAMREKRRNMENVRLNGTKGGADVGKPFQPRPRMDGRMPSRPVRTTEEIEE